MAAVDVDGLPAADLGEVVRRPLCGRVVVDVRCELVVMVQLGWFGSSERILGGFSGDLGLLWPRES